MTITDIASTLSQEFAATVAAAEAADRADLENMINQVNSAYAQLERDMEKIEEGRRKALNDLVSFSAAEETVLSAYSREVQRIAERLREIRNRKASPEKPKLITGRKA